MQTHHDTLTYLIAHPGTARAVKRASASAAPASLQGLLLSGLYKRAQGDDALGEASKGVQHRFVQSMEEQDARRQQEAARAAARRHVAPNWGLTGDKNYDNLPDVRKRRAKQYMDKVFDEYYKSREDLTQKKDQATIEKEVGPIKSWGDYPVQRLKGAILSFPMQHLLAGGHAVEDVSRNLSSGRPALQGLGNTIPNAVRDSLNLGHDVANNVQMQAEGLRHGAETVLRAINHLVRPTTWRNDAESKVIARDRKNSWDNASMAHMERSRRIFNNYDESSLRDINNPMALANYGINTAVGEFTGGEAATYGTGAAAKAIGSGINAGTHALSAAVRGGAAGANIGRAAEAAGTGARLMQGARDMAARGIDAMGETVAVPFNAAGALTTPLASGRSAATAVGRDLWNTGKNAVSPVRDIYGLIRHPRMSMEAFRATPYTHVWNGITYVPRWAWHTATPIGRHAFSDQGFKAMTAASMMKDMYGGDYGSAIGSLGEMGGYGAIGPVMIPLELAGGMFLGGDEQ